jgi:hypothetical protein
LTPQEEIDDIVYKPASDDEEAMQVDKIEDVVKKPIAVKMQQTNTVKASHTLAMVFFSLSCIFATDFTPNIHQSQ